jgi:hypothetical protein
MSPNTTPHNVPGPAFQEEQDPHFAQSRVPYFRRRDEDPYWYIDYPQYRANLRVSQLPPLAWDERILKIVFTQPDELLESPIAEQRELPNGEATEIRSDIVAPAEEQHEQLNDEGTTEAPSVVVIPTEENHEQLPDEELTGLHPAETQHEQLSTVLPSIVVTPAEEQSEQPPTGKATKLSPAASTPPDEPTVATATAQPDLSREKNSPTVTMAEVQSDGAVSNDGVNTGRSRQRRRLRTDRSGRIF